MKLETINRALAVFGLILVVQYWDGVGEQQPTRLYLTTRRVYARRIQ